MCGACQFTINNLLTTKINEDLGACQFIASKIAGISVKWLLFHLIIFLGILQASNNYDSYFRWSSRFSYIVNVLAILIIQIQCITQFIKNWIIV